MRRSQMRIRFDDIKLPVERVWYEVKFSSISLTICLLVTFVRQEWQFNQNICFVIKVYLKIEISVTQVVGLQWTV